MTQLADILSRGLAERYRVEREVGRGGMATVFLAEDLRYGRLVAVKVLLPDLASAVGSERFLREIRIAAGLRHPNILPVLDSGDVEGLPFYVMPFVEGESLRDKLLREKQLPIPEAIQIGREVADALFHAHERGVVHRDIKPANIMLDSGHAVVTDFGIALATQQAGSDRLSATGVSPGSPHYMSPEQATGEGDIDGRSDIYSLGCVLYEALAGDPPFTGRMPQAILAKKLTEPPPSLTTVRETAPMALVGAISRCLVRAPADRFRTARELRDALDGATAWQASDGGPLIAPWDDHARGSSQHRWTALVVGGVGGTLALCTMVGFLTTRIYDLKLGIPTDFTPSRVDFPLVGLEALIPELFYAFVALLTYVILSHTWSLIAYWLKRTSFGGGTLHSRTRSPVWTWREMLSSMSPTAVADLLFIFSVVAGLLTLLPFRELLTSLWSGGTEALSYSNRDLHKSYTLVLTLLILAVLFTWREVVAHLRGRGPLSPRTMISKWGSLAWIVVLVLVVTAPWRLLWNNYHERVLLNGARAYLLIETDAEVVIYQPEIGSSGRYVKGEELNLRRLGSLGYLYELPEAFEAAAGAPGRTLSRPEERS